MSIAALYVRSDTVYQQLGCDCWDVDRDARRYVGPGPIVAHPPCAGWGAYRMKRREQWRRAAWGITEVDRDARSVMCGPFAVDQVSRFGGVLEHPANSQLWAYCHLPEPGEPANSCGGFSVEVEQSWWGHRAPKRTWLYVVGAMPLEIELPDFDSRPEPVRTIEQMGVDERERTPKAFAEWLVRLAEKCAGVPA